MFTNLPIVTKALLIANCAVFVLQLVLGPALNAFMLWPWLPAEIAPYAPYGFMPWQLLTHGFMHDPANPAHLLFNLLGILMFGAPLEFEWKARRYVTYYLVCMVGAGLCQLAFASWMLQHGHGLSYSLGASGAVFGLLLAYGVLFPNRRIILPFIPIPFKARTLVLVFGVLELVLGLAGHMGVGHFAHLGGMLFGWLLIRYWRGRPPFGGRHVRRRV